MATQREPNQRARARFDRWAVPNDSGHVRRWVRALQQRTIGAMMPGPQDHILDVGCGTGWAVGALAALLPKGRVCGVDLSPVMVERAQANVRAPNAEFQVADVEDIPYDDEQFDIVMCSSAFHHYPRPVQALTEFRRVLRPGGRVFVLDVCRDGLPLVLLYDFAQRLLGDHVRYYHTSELWGFMRQAGLQSMREEFRVQKLFLYGKVLTSLTLLSAQR